MEIVLDLIFSARGGENIVNKIITAMWQIIFHELRHLVQCTTLQHPDQFFGDKTLRQLHKQYPRVAAPAKHHISLYKRIATDPLALAAEIDAVIASNITIAHFCHSYNNQDPSIDMDGIIRALLLPEPQLENALSWLRLKP